MTPAAIASRVPNAATGSSRDPRVPWKTPPSGAVSLVAGSAAVRADLAAGVVELAGHLVTEEHHCRDDRECDQGDEEDVLHHAGATLVLGELGLKPGAQYEQVHVLASSLS